MKLTGNDDSTIDFDGVRYPLNLAYPVVLTVFKIVQDKGLAAEERLTLCIRLLVRGDAARDLDPSRQQVLFEQIFAQDIDLKEHALAAKLFKSTEKAFDFDVDAARIAASFMQQYHIDLTDAQERNRISWAFFNALLDGLGPDTPFRQATAYRVAEIPDDATNEQRDYLQKMKVLYELNPDSKAEPTIEQATAGMDRIQKIKYLAELRKQKRGEKNG